MAIQTGSYEAALIEAQIRSTESTAAFFAALAELVVALKPLIVDTANKKVGG